MTLCRARFDLTSQPDAWLLDPCPDCGHSGAFHPGSANPRVRACALCRLDRALRVTESSGTHRAESRPAPKAVPKRRAS